MNLLYPHALVERVSVGWNFVYAGGVPLVTLILSLVVLRADGHKFHVTLLGFFIAYAIPFELLGSKLTYQACTLVIHNRCHQERSRQAPSRPDIKMQTGTRNT